MQYVRLGNTGLKVSRICLGMMTYGTSNWRDWVLDEEDSRPFVQRALELGINFFDTADVYSLGVSEEVTGRALRDFAERDEIVVATKVYNPMSDDVNDRGLSRKHIMAGIDNSLRRLGMDYVDLYQIHRWDKETPIEETMEALHDVVKAGKARYIGASSMYAWQFATAQHVADRQRLDALRLHAESLQPHLPRRRAGDDPLLHRPGRRRHPVESAGTRLPGGHRSREEWGTTTRSKSDDFAHRMYYADGDFDVVERVGEIAGKLGVSLCAGRAGVDAAQAGRDRRPSSARARCRTWKRRWPRWTSS